METLELAEVRVVPTENGAASGLRSEWVGWAACAAPAPSRQHRAALPCLAVPALEGRSVVVEGDTAWGRPRHRLGASFLCHFARS